MRLELDASAADFLAASGAWLERDEAANCLMLGIVRGAPPAGLFARVLEGNDLVTCAVQVPPGSLVISFAPAAALELLAHALVDPGATLPGVVGPADAADQFA